jgi:hypothetical protein
VTSWSLVQRSPTNCGASLCVIPKPRGRGGHSPRWAAEPETTTISHLVFSHLHARAYLSLFYSHHILNLQCIYFYFMFCLLKSGPLLSLTHVRLPLHVLLSSEPNFLSWKVKFAWMSLLLFVEVLLQFYVYSTTKLLELWYFWHVSLVSNLKLCPDSCNPSRVLLMNNSVCVGGFRFGTSVSPRAIAFFQIPYNSSFAIHPTVLLWEGWRMWVYTINI